MMAIAVSEILITLYLITQCHEQNITASTASDSSHEHCFFREDQCLSCSRSSPALKESYGSLHRSKQPATGSCSESNPIYSLPPYFFNIQFNIILLNEPVFIKWHLPFGCYGEKWDTFITFCLWLS